MFFYQYILVLGLLFLWLKASNQGAFILLVAYVFYSFLLYIDIPADEYSYYYLINLLSNLVLLIALTKRYFLAALCSCALIFVNIYGYLAWFLYFPPDTYDNICAIMLIIQFIFIANPRLLDGPRRTHDSHSLDEPHGFNSDKACVTMFKNAPKKKANR